MNQSWDDLTPQVEAIQLRQQKGETLEPWEIKILLAHAWHHQPSRLEQNYGRP